MSSHRPASLHRLAGRYDNPTPELTILPPPTPKSGTKNLASAITEKGQRCNGSLRMRTNVMRIQSSKNKEEGTAVKGSRSNEKERKELYCSRGARIEK